ncbi:MAG: hypothetical protein AB1445_09030 [Bacillota bacterium]
MARIISVADAYDAVTPRQIHLNP